MAYWVFLVNPDSSSVLYGALLNLGIIAFVLREQRRLGGHPSLGPAHGQALRVLAAGLTCLVLLGLGMRLVLTPAFASAFRTPVTEEEGPPSLFAGEQSGLVLHTLEYLLNNQDSRFVGRLRLQNGSPVFTRNDLQSLRPLKRAVQSALAGWRVALIALVSVGAWAWVTGTLLDFRKGAAAGARLLTWMLAALTSAAVVAARLGGPTLRGLALAVVLSLVPHSDIARMALPAHLWIAATVAAVSIPLLFALSLRRGLDRRRPDVLRAQGQF
jgi:hypothetical protein